jgi:hypothetical protein
MRKVLRCSAGHAAGNDAATIIEERIMAESKVGWALCRPYTPPVS